MNHSEYGMPPLTVTDPRECGPKAWGTLSMAKFTLHILKRYGGRNGLDIGARTGGFCHFMQLAGINSIGLELDPAAVQIATDRGEVS